MHSFLVSENIKRALPFILGLLAVLLVFNLIVEVLPSSTTPTAENTTRVLTDFSLPGAVDLCGESIPLENLHVLEMLDREFTIAVWDRAQVFMWLKRSGRYFPYIEAKLAEATMPDDLKYVPVAESALIPDARSRKRAVGLWQFMTHTGRRYGLRKNRLIDERRDFEQSTEAAIEYLKHLYDKFGSWTLALAAYNCGDALLKREIRKQKVKDFYRLRLPPETERYIFRIAAAKIIMEHPQQYGFNLPPEQTYRPLWYDTVEVRLRRRLNLTDLAQGLGTDYRVLRRLNPQIRHHYLPKGHHTIKVPPGFGSKVEIALQQLKQIPPRNKNKTYESYYVVQDGDTLGHISKRTGVSIATLRSLNEIHGSTIWAGQKLRLTP
ncbi:MAG: transglycosylase SLT domain-containing protein [Syntrophobacterales bacterium]|jgi:hypothetical protein